nr:hypothetical protein [Gemmiger qucibialis]
MENQTHAQNQRVPVIQVSGLKKQYKLGQIGGGTLTHDLQSWWARVRGKEDPNTVIGTDARLFGKTFMALNGVDLTVYKGEALALSAATVQANPPCSKFCPALPPLPRRDPPARACGFHAGSRHRLQQRNDRPRKHLHERCHPWHDPRRGRFQN